jgi:hypothetical protein
VATRWLEVETGERDVLRVRFGPRLLEAQGKRGA